MRRLSLRSSSRARLHSATESSGIHGAQPRSDDSIRSATSAQRLRSPGRLDWSPFSRCIRRRGSSASKPGRCRAPEAGRPRWLRIVIRLRCCLGLWSYSSPRTDEPRFGRSKSPRSGTVKAISMAADRYTPRPDRRQNPTANRIANKLGLLLHGEGRPRRCPRAVLRRREARRSRPLLLDGIRPWPSIGSGDLGEAESRSSRRSTSRVLWACSLPAAIASSWRSLDQAKDQARKQLRRAERYRFL